MKKIWKPILIIVIMAIVVIILFELKLGEGKTNQNTVENNSEETVTRLDQVANNIENEETIPNNTVENNETENEEEPNQNNEVPTTPEIIKEPVTTEESAIEKVSKTWGTDSTVYFTSDGIDENGNYIICVREKSSTKALYWYTVNKKDRNSNNDVKKENTKMGKEKINFEENIKQLEQIVQELESGTLNLDDSMKKFEEGIKISKECSSYLEEAEKKISILVKDDNGNLVEENF